MAAFQVETSSRFDRQAKKLAKRYHSWADDFDGLLDILEETPLLGESLGRGCYKIRLAIASKAKGKSGGARVITLVRIQAERVVLLTVYDKADRENLHPGELDTLLAEPGLTGE